jgi:hypothetical protein
MASISPSRPFMSVQPPICCLLQVQEELGNAVYRGRCSRLGPAEPSLVDQQQIRRVGGLVPGVQGRSGVQGGGAGCFRGPVRSQPGP